MFPLASNEVLSTDLRGKLENLTSHLAFQLRLQRRRGVYPLSLNLVWFLIAFVISMYTAFGEVGDNLTAHSLALGLLLSWIPVLVLASIIDRNPVSTTRCKVLIERWLFNIDVLFCRTTYPGYPINRNRPIQWRKRKTKEDTDDFSDFSIGEFVGQGRRLRYCAVADTVLDMRQDREKNSVRDLPNATDAEEFRLSLTIRPIGWYVVWSFSQLLVGLAYATAFIVSFETPTKGLGCRSFAYTLWYGISVASWLFILFCQEPPFALRFVSWFSNAAATLALFTIMGLQVFGALNMCYCKSSKMHPSSAWGGYMDFENAAFYSKAYDVRTVWGWATGIGSFNCLFGIFFFCRRYSQDTGLWRVNEESEQDVIKGVDLHWLT